jgi:hypothetical protein
LDPKPPGPASHLNTKSIGLYEAIELRTVVIITILFGVEFYRPGLIYSAIFILMGAWLLGRVVIEMVVSLLSSTSRGSGGSICSLTSLLCLPYYSSLSSSLRFNLTLLLTIASYLCFLKSLLLLLEPLLLLAITCFLPLPWRPEYSSTMTLLSCFLRQGLTSLSALLLIDKSLLESHIPMLILMLLLTAIGAIGRKFHQGLGRYKHIS